MDRGITDPSDSGEEEIHTACAKAYPLAGRAESFGTDTKDEVLLEAEPSDDDDLVGGGYMPMGGDDEEEEEVEDEAALPLPTRSVRPVRDASPEHRIPAVSKTAVARVAPAAATAAQAARPQAVPRVGDMLTRVSPAKRPALAENAPMPTTAARRRSDLQKQPSPTAAAPPPPRGGDMGAYRSFKPSSMRAAYPPAPSALLSGPRGGYSSTAEREQDEGNVRPQGGPLDAERRQAGAMRSRPQNTMFSKSSGIRGTRMESPVGDNSLSTAGLSSSSPATTPVAEDVSRPVLRFPAKKSIVPTEVDVDVEGGKPEADEAGAPEQKDCNDEKPGEVRTPALRRTMHGPPPTNVHRRRDDRPTVHAPGNDGARGPGAAAKLRRASAEQETASAAWRAGPRRDGEEKSAEPPSTIAQLIIQPSENEEKEAETAVPQSQNGTTAPATTGTGVPQRISARYRDMLQMKRRAKRKSGERVRMYVNATSMKPVVLAAATQLRFDFAPLRDSAQLIWVDRGISVETAKTLVEEKQRLNKYPGMKEMCNKVLFTHHLNRMAALFPDDFAFYPQTYCVPGDEDELRHLLQATPQKRSKKRIDLKRNIWICKPSKGRQGAGIFLTQDLNDVLCERKNPDIGYVIQKYIPNPMLIDGLKFDLRLYVLVTCVDPLRVHIFDEGLARFATNPWQPLDNHAMYDAYMHLTNYSLNKDNENFVANTDLDNQDKGSKRSIKSIRDWLDRNGHNSEKVWGDINAMVVNTMLALQASLQLNMEAISKPADDPFKCFQILGFDVMFDDALKPWLLEINAGPSLEADSPLDQAVKEPLVLQSLRLGTYGLLPRHKPSHRKNFEAAHCSRFDMIYPSKSAHLHEHLVLFNKELRDCFDAACGLKKGEMTASRFCKFFRECGVIRSFKTHTHHGEKKERGPILLTDDTIEQPKSSYVTNKAFELRRKMTEKREEPAVHHEDEFKAPEGYEPRYGLAKFNLDIPPNLTDKIRTLTQPELELLFLRKAKSEGTTGLSFFEFINIVVEMAQLAYGAKEFDHFSLLQKLRLFIPSRKDPNVRAEPIAAKSITSPAPLSKRPANAPTSPTAPAPGQRKLSATASKPTQARGPARSHEVSATDRH
eukprot:TRINITY_DN1461_c0_g1_i1.p1 TRINITY_DN1461_c0_g1~~TRINITY_DN1461_c0_g1_i1.p1  ORF type:complete len:1115 (+),score=337.47 TRINITY_DN1461_c0_g1_i1:71-3415(+)